jgi:hypothetical protein
MKRFSLLLTLSAAGCEPPAASPPAAPPKVESGAPRLGATLAADFTAWPSVTEKPYPVPPARLFYCRGPSPKEIKEIEDEKKSRGPHSESAVIVRVNPVGRGAFLKGRTIPVGTIVVKEKHPHYMESQPPVAIAAMIKREAGYDVEHGDWEYYFEKNEKREEAKPERGKLRSCIDCHQSARAKDYLFRPYLKPEKAPDGDGKSDGGVNSKD